MSKRKAIIIVAGLALGSLLLAGSPALAQTGYPPYANQWGGYQQQPPWGGNTNDPRFDHREAYQQQRIQQGIDSGALTPGETRYLEREEARIDRARERMEADGNLSYRERQRLNRMQDQASRDIYRMEHNNRTAMGYEGDHPGWRDHNRGWDEREQRGWQGRDHDRDRRDWDRRNAGWQGHNRDWDGRNYGWHGNNPVGADHTPGGNGYNHGWQANGNSGWHGTNPSGNGYPGRTTSGGTTTPGYNQGQGHRGYGWNGNNYGGSGTTSGGTTATYNQRRGNGGYGWNGNNHGGSGTTTGGTTTTGTATAGNTQGWQGNYARNGQQGSYQQPGAQNWSRSGQPGAWQGQQQYQRPSFQGTQPQMRPSQPAPWQGQQYQQARMQAPQPQMRANVMPQQPVRLGGMVNRANFSAPRVAPRTR